SSDASQRRTVGPAASRRRVEGWPDAACRGCARQLQLYRIDHSRRPESAGAPDAGSCRKQGAQAGAHVYWTVGDRRSGDGEISRVIGGRSETAFWFTGRRCTPVSADLLSPPPLQLLQHLFNLFLFLERREFV